MKTGNVSQGSTFLAQTRSSRPDKAAQKKQDTAIEEKVDLSTNKPSVIPSAAASYEDVLELLYGLDFSQFKDLQWISKEGASKLMDLMQN